MGRFVSEDPSGLGPDANLYRYVENSPYNYTDATGRELQSPLTQVLGRINGEVRWNDVNLLDGHTGGAHGGWISSDQVRRWGLATEFMGLAPAGPHVVHEHTFKDANAREVIYTEWSDGSHTYSNARSFEYGQMVERPGGLAFVEDGADLVSLGSGPSGFELMSTGIGFVAPIAMGGQATVGTFGKAFGEEIFSGVTGLPWLNPRSLIKPTNAGSYLGAVPDALRGSGDDIARSVPSSSVAGSSADASRRAYLNAKFGRTGDLDADINARGIDNAVHVNAEHAADYARLNQNAGRIGPSAQQFGMDAHNQHFRRINNRLANRVAGTYDVATEQFRSATGLIVPPRTLGSIGADVLYDVRATGTRAVFDLKTFSTTPRPISGGRQTQFTARFGVRAQEIFVRQHP